MEDINHSNFPQAISFIIGEVAEIKSLILKNRIPPEKEMKEFISLKDVCQLTGYSAPSIYRFIGQNSIPYFKKNGRLFFETAAIIAWLKEGKRKSTAEVEVSADTRLLNYKKIEL
jgi:predicted DNA-binding transcriptional regulator AlpA